MYGIAKPTGLDLDNTLSDGNERTRLTLLSFFYFSKCLSVFGQGGSDLPKKSKPPLKRAAY
ncbi:MAG: hypothetical protein CVU00_04645 [Bacteroidetes bacterium HGW-Bacteroidetes-17]|nr:MAG: hypothetical protein CVU00_04645 [Bacteroidetes bacterium HGW-Bacteroidetes-17]